MNKTIMHHSYNTDFTVINQSINDMEIVDLEVVTFNKKWKQEFDSLKAIFPNFVVSFYCGDFDSYCTLREVNSFEAIESLFEDYYEGESNY